ncbi:hypothetical protein Nepgr_033010 [Nepenthes gracilis]|uniref:Transcription termination factor MTEF1, chloroplastic n=1 Tax=Nepenthes gracilis TaxID=150966 RepID=A0AAD3Y691_NEPGR|nr:hypothetical protein Nepgr_033010 [Nepenthes gracilis]
MMSFLPQLSLPLPHHCSSSKPFQNPTVIALRSPTTVSNATTDSGIQFRRKLLYLRGLNVNALEALRKNPEFRSTPLRTLKSVETCLASMGIERAALGRIFDMYPQLLTCDPYLDLYPVFGFLLNDVEIPFPDVRTAIIRCPRLLICGVDDQLMPTLWFLRKLGFVGRQAITCQTTVLLVSSVENTLLRKLEYLRSLGLSCSEVANMVLRSPGLLTFSIENNYRPKVEYFLREMKGDIVEIKRFPQYFSFSLERKIKPRHKLLLDHGFSMSLSDMLKVSDGEFNLRLTKLRLRCLEEFPSAEVLLLNNLFLISVLTPKDWKRESSISCFYLYQLPLLDVFVYWLKILGCVNPLIVLDFYTFPILQFSSIIFIFLKCS